MKHLVNLVSFLVCPRLSIGGGGSSGAFSRKGTGTHVRNYTVPDAINSLITTNAEGATIDPTLATDQVGLFHNLLTSTPQTQPGYAELSNFTDTSPTDYSGRPALLAVSERNPYSSQYEEDTLDAYKQRASDAMARVASGPAAVRGGAARTGVLQALLAERLAEGRGREVREVQQEDVRNVIASSEGMANIENRRLQSALAAALGLDKITSGVEGRALAAGREVDNKERMNMGLLQLAAQLQGATNDIQTDDFSGQGDQSGWQAGISCCFTFLASGKLPWFFELARQDLWTEERRCGYNVMSCIVVPLMRRFAWVKSVIRRVLVEPFLCYGSWLYGESEWTWRCALCTPYVNLWLSLWTGLGKVIKWQEIILGCRIGVMGFVYRSRMWQLCCHLVRGTSKHKSKTS